MPPCFAPTYPAVPLLLLCMFVCSFYQLYRYVVSLIISISSSYSQCSGPYNNKIVFANFICASNWGGRNTRYYEAGLSVKRAYGTGEIRRASTDIYPLLCRCSKTRNLSSALHSHGYVPYALL
jgi:hypothetical protein